MDRIIMIIHIIRWTIVNTIFLILTLRVMNHECQLCMIAVAICAELNGANQRRALSPACV